MSEGYEFTEQQNQEFSTLHSRIHYFTIFIVIAGVLITVNAYFLITGRQGLTALPVLGVGLLFVVLGVLFRRPLDNIRNIINTQRKDIPELMRAIDDFTQAFWAASIVGFVYLALLVWRILALFLSGG